MKYYTFLIKFVFLSNFISAQSRLYYDKADLVTTEMNCYYFKEGQIVSGSERTFKDTVKAYYCSSKKSRSIEVFNSQGIQNGFSLYYYENGSLKERAYFKLGARFGIATEYYESGKAKAILAYSEAGTFDLTYPFKYRLLSCWDTAGVQTVTNSNGYCNYYSELLGKQIIESGKIVNGLRDSTWTIRFPNHNEYLIEDYSLGKFIKGKRVMDGQVVSEYNEFQTQAEIDGGLNVFYNRIMNELKYPRISRNNGVEGKVFVEFIINESGLLSEFNVVSSPNKELADEAIRVVKLSPKWNPARIRGFPIRSRYVVPVTFKLG
ncbi:MAG: TonB family protein [Flammeovirgaceae bacterium]|nr:MAG: TonB family protein [Flammeovirgaceae bacterium]